MLDKEVKENIVSTLKIKNLSQEKQVEIISRLEKIIRRKVILSITEKLEEKDQNSLLTLIEFGDDKDVSLFLESRIPHLDLLIKTIAISTVEEFKNKI